MKAQSNKNKPKYIMNDKPNNDTNMLANIEDMESTFDNIAHELNNVLDGDTFLDLYLEFRNKAQAEIQKNFPEHEFANF